MGPEYDHSAEDGSGHATDAEPPDARLGCCKKYKCCGYASRLDVGSEALTTTDAQLEFGLTPPSLQRAGSVSRVTRHL